MVSEISYCKPQNINKFTPQEFGPLESLKGKFNHFRKIKLQYYKYTHKV